MNIEEVKKLNITTESGCYQFLNENSEILYIGKAVNLKKRVLSYFKKNALHTPAKKSMVSQINTIKIIKTDSEIEAFLLESNLIKKHQPKYNILMRDDKRFQYIKITTDEFPRIITTRNIDKTGRYFGPFTSGLAVRETIKAIGKIFPYGKFATMPNNKANELKIKRYPELYNAPEEIDKYKKTIKEIEIFLNGESKKITRMLEKEIKELSKNQKNKKEVSYLKYRLLRIKNVLAHANVLSIYDKYASDVIELAKTLELPKIPNRIEGYDIAHIFGQEMVGSMVVFTKGEPNKKEYRKFKIKDIKGKADDTKALKEIIKRRFNNDWDMPELIIIDGGKGQLNACLSILKKLKLTIPIISISKGEGLRSAKAPDKIFFPGEKKPLKLPLASPTLHLIKRVRDESHRFAITFHRNQRTKTFLQKK